MWIGLAIISGIIFCECAYAVPNPEHGVRREFYPNGQKRMESLYKNGRVVRLRSFYENGKVMADTRYKGSMQSTKTFYENGVLRSQWSQKTGVMKLYNRQGVLTQETRLED